MVHMCQVAQFVDNYIVKNSRRSQHEPPVEGESTSGAAASPAGFLVPNGNAVVCTAGKLTEISRSFREIFFGGIDISPGQGRTLRIGQAGYRTVGLFLKGFQIFCDDPVLLFDENALKFPAGGMQRYTYGDLALGRDADGVTLAAAADKCVWQFI